MPPAAQHKPSFWNLDFKALIPVILFLVAQMIIGATWLVRLETRISLREQENSPIERRLEKLEQDRDAIIRVQEQLRLVVQTLDKLDQKLERLRPP